LAPGKRNSHVLVKFALKGGEPARIGGREHAAGRARRRASSGSRSESLAAAVPVGPRRVCVRGDASAIAGLGRENWL